MTRPAVRSPLADRAGLAALGLLLGLSVAARVDAYQSGGIASAPAIEAEAGDLGGGLYLPLVDATRRALTIAACPRPVTVDFVEASPHGRDASLATPEDPGDRVAYIYRGRTVEGRYAAMILSIRHFMRRAGAVLQLTGAVPANERAVKLVVPARCGVSLDDVMNAIRRDVPPRP